jgi:hypothetical protein
MTKTEEKTIYDLEIHETLVVKNNAGGNMEITRVAGGWIYCLEYPGFRQSPIVFVPFVVDNTPIATIKTNKTK